MNTLRIVIFIFLCIISLSFIPNVRAVEPAWTYSVDDSAISKIAISSDGSTIIVAADKLWIFSKSGTLVKKESFGDDIVLTPSGRFAASSFGGTIYFFSTPLTAGPSDPNELTRIWDYDLPDPVRSIEITNDGSIIVAATQGMGVFFITTATKNMASSDAFYNAIIRITHSGSRIVGISSDTIRLYSRNGKISKSYAIKSTNQPKFALLSETVPLIVFNDGLRIHSFDLTMGADLWNVRPSGTLNSLAMTPSGSYVVAGTENGNVSLYDDKGNLNWTYSANRDNSQNAGISKLAISKDGGVIVAASNDGNIYYLNMRGTLLGSYWVEDPIRDIALSEDGSIFLVASEKKIYAFLTGYSPYARSSNPAVQKTTSPGSINASDQNITSPQETTRRPIMTTRTKASVTGTITEIPTEYSIIRTPTQSPLAIWSGILALVAGIVLYRTPRH